MLGRRLMVKGVGCLLLSNKVDALGRDYGLFGNSDSMKIERGQGET